MELTAEVIRAARKLKGMSQREFADILDVHYRTVQQWEAGTMRPTIENANVMTERLAPELRKILSEHSAKHRAIVGQDSNQAILYRSAPIAPSHAKAVRAARERQRKAMDMLAQIQADLAGGGDIMPAMAKIAMAQRELVAAQTELERIQ